MKRDRASRIKGFIIDVQNYEALHKQLLFTPDLLPEDGRQVMERIDWQAGSVTHTSGTCAITEASRHTPPHVDTSECEDTRSGTRTDTTGLWRWKAQSSLIIPIPHTFSPSKKVITRSFHARIACNSKRDVASLFQRFTPHQKDQFRSALLAKNLTSIDMLMFKCIDSLLYHGVAYVRKYCCPTRLYRGVGSQRTMRYVVEVSNWPICEGDQKKNGNRPEPGKPTKPKPEKPKPEREGDKGKRKGKSPRTEQLVS